MGQQILLPCRARGSCCPSKIACNGITSTLIQEKKIPPCGVCWPNNRGSSSYCSSCDGQSPRRNCRNCCLLCPGGHKGRRQQTTCEKDSSPRLRHLRFRPHFVRFLFGRQRAIQFEERRAKIPASRDTRQCLYRHSS